MSVTTSPEVAAFYSVIRYVADPFRDEPINVGLVMATADGEWSRFRVMVPKTKFWAIGRRHEVDLIEQWARLVERSFGTTGYRGVFGEFGQLSPEVIGEWSRTFGQAIRLTPPRVAVDTSLDVLWSDLFRNLVRGGRPSNEYGGLEVAPPSLGSGRRQARDARTERQFVIDDFVTSAERWATFDQRLIYRDATFEGRRATHLADLALKNGQLTGIIQVLPVAYGSEADVITKRALILEAAVDVEPSVAKLAIYLDPPAERRDLLEETLAVIADFPGEARVTPIAARNIDDLESQFGAVLFPALPRRP